MKFGRCTCAPLFLSTTRYFRDEPLPVRSLFHPLYSILEAQSIRLLDSSRTHQSPPLFAPKSRLKIARNGPPGAQSSNIKGGHRPRDERGRVMPSRKELGPLSSLAGAYIWGPHAPFPGAIGASLGVSRGGLWGSQVSRASAAARPSVRACSSPARLRRPRFCFRSCICSSWQKTREVQHAPSLTTRSTRGLRSQHGVSPPWPCAAATAFCFGPRPRHGSSRIQQHLSEQ